MMRIFAAFVVLLTLFVGTGSGAEATKATVLVRGAHCDACVAAIRKQLISVKGTKVDPDDLRVGEKPRYFSQPFVVEVGNTLDSGIGALAKATADARAPHKNDIPPRLNLVLYTDATIDEPAVMALRAALREVNGVLVSEAGGLGGFPNRGFYWIRLEPAGGADLQQIFQAAKQVVDVSLTDE